MAQGTPSSDSATPRRFRWRRLVQSSLRTLLIVMTVLAVWMGWWSHKARQQRAAVTAIRAAGGIVQYDFERKKLNRPANWPVWLVNVMGVDYFAHVQAVFFSGTKVTDAQLEHLAKLPALEAISLGATTVTDADLARVRGLTALQGIRLDGTKITDAGLKHLEDLAALQVLDLGETKITDAGLARLNFLISLRYLYLGYTQITDAGVEHLTGLTGLKELHLEETKVSDAGVQRLRKALPDCNIVR